MSTINKRVGFKFFLLLGTIVRLVIAPFSGYEFDVGVLKFAARSYYEHREVTLFTEWTSPPLLYYIVLVSYSFYYLLHYRFEEVAGLGIPDFYPLAHSVGALETLFLKLPFITADVLIFILLTRCCSLLGLDDKKGLFISNIYFLSPYTIFVSAAHGMWDSLAALFLVLGAYCLIRSHTEDDFKYVYYAVLSFTASFGVKWVGLAPLFVLGSLLLAKKEYTHLLKATLLSVGVLLLFYVPFLFQGTEYLMNVLDFRSTGGITIPFSANHFQMLIVLGVSPPLIKKWFVPAYLVFCVILLLVILGVYHRTSITKRNGISYPDVEVFLLFTLLMLTIFYLFYHSVNVQLFVWFVALAPLFLALTDLKEDLRVRFRSYLFSFALIAGVFVVVLIGAATLYGIAPPNPVPPTKGRIAFYIGIASLLPSLYFAYMSFLIIIAIVYLFEEKWHN